MQLLPRLTAAVLACALLADADPEVLVALLQPLFAALLSGAPVPG